MSTDNVQFTKSPIPSSDAEASKLRQKKNAKHFSRRVRFVSDAARQPIMWPGTVKRLSSAKRVTAIDMWQLFTQDELHGLSKSQIKSMAGRKSKKDLLM